MIEGFASFRAADRRVVSGCNITGFDFSTSTNAPRALSSTSRRLLELGRSPRALGFNSAARGRS
jgi:hypothetical protein